MRWKWFLIGLVAFPVLASVAGWVFLKTRADGFSARAQPTLAETVLATEARKLAIPAAARSRTNPVSDSPEVLAEARAHWPIIALPVTGTTAAGTRLWASRCTRPRRTCASRAPNR